MNHPPNSDQAGPDEWKPPLQSWILTEENAVTVEGTGMTTEGTADASAVGSSTKMISDVNFVKVGGAITMVAPFLFVGALLSGVDTTANEVFDMAGHLLYLVVIVTLYQLFRDEGAAIRLAAVIGVVGMLLIVLVDFFALARLEMVAQIAAADAATAPALEAMKETISVLIVALEAVGNGLAWGIGGGLFSFAILRTDRLPHWLGWGGLLFAATMLVTPFDVMFSAGSTLESMVFFLGNMYGRLWLVVLGIFLIRLDASEVP